jgi:predicted regulator of Ras-like GTPase activity (Roadblock/LC7/MglB family)
MTTLEDILAKLRRELASVFISTDIVGMDGLSIAGGSIDPDFDATAASARFATVAKLGKDVSEKLQLGEMDDLLITTDQVYIIQRLIGDGSYYWGLAVTKDATLGMVRLLMKENVEDIWKAIPK